MFIWDLIDHLYSFALYLLNRHIHYVCVLIDRISTQNEPTRPEMDFKIISQELKYSRYLQLYNSRVQYPNSKEFEFDVCCSRSRLFVVVFPYFPKTNTVRVIREYCQGVNELRYSLPSGGFDPKKHSSARECAVQELREEALLADGLMVDLLPSNVY